jgi:Uma2 family endonuclease
MSVETNATTMPLPDVAAPPTAPVGHSADQVEQQHAPPGAAQQFVLDGLSWASYVALNDALSERTDVRVFYLDGRLTLVTKSFEHDSDAEYLGFLVGVIAGACRLECVPAGSATYRKPETTGVEGDKMFYFGASADRMKGQTRIDLASQPPPDLAIEVELTHSADDAIRAYASLGIREVWRFSPALNAITFLELQPNSTYVSSGESRCIPKLTPDDVLNQLKQGRALGLGRWLTELLTWAQTELNSRA